MPTGPTATLSKFRTVRFKAPSCASALPADPWTAVARAEMEYQFARDYRDLLGGFLAEQGHRFHSLLEQDPTGGWRIHFFARATALAYLDDIAIYPCGPGDPVELDPEWVVRVVERWP
jgi:hypothetical protein